MYRAGRRTGVPDDLSDALAVCRGRGDTFLWIGTHEPTEDEFALVTSEFGLHRLAVEDALRAHQRPKLEVYDGSLFVVLKPVVYEPEGDTVTSGELMLFIGDSFVVTVRHGEGAPLAAVRRRLEADPGVLRHGPAAVLYAVCDAVVDHYIEVAGELQEDLEELEESVFAPADGGSGRAARRTAARIYGFKRQVLEFRRAAGPLAEPMARLAGAAVPFVPERARLFFIDNNVHISTALSFASMPACYVIPHVAKLLAATHALDYPSRRMAETGQFTVYLMRPDAFETGSRFIPAAQKVRLLHASIRHHLRQENRWDVANLGTPICQEDMIGGQVAFSLMVLDAMHRLGIHMSNEGADAFYYAWRVVGAMLGCSLDHMPKDLEEARLFSDLYLSRHMGPSEEGVRLTRQLIDLYEEVVPGTVFDPVVPAMIRYLIGDTAADWLDVPRSPLWDSAIRTAPAFLGVLETLEDNSPFAAWALDRLGHFTSVFELSALTRGRVMQYAIPEQLKNEYGVTSAKPRLDRWAPPPLTPTL
nr:CorA family divalent cation transporter [Streptomyces clavuligerus]